MKTISAYRSDSLLSLLLHSLSSGTCTHHPIFLPHFLPVSLHSSLTFSAYLTTMATGDVLAYTEMRHTEKNGFVRRHVRRLQSPHACFVAERHDPLSKHGSERRERERMCESEGGAA